METIYRKKIGETDLEFEERVFGVFVPHDQRPKSEQLPTPEEYELQHQLSKLRAENEALKATLNAEACEHHRWSGHATHTCEPRRILEDLVSCIHLLVDNQDDTGLAMAIKILHDYEEKGMG